MKTKIKRISKSTLAVILSLMMLLSTSLLGSLTANAADYTSSHFYLIGEIVGGDWTATNTSYPINTGYGSSGKFYREVSVSNSGKVYFALSNGSTQYGPSGSDAKLTSTEVIGTYNTDKAWYYEGSASKIRICINQRDNTSDNQWYPYVWIEEVATTTTYTVTKGITSNGSFTVSPTSCASGSTVTVTATPNSGYEVDSAYYVKSGSSNQHAISMSSNKGTFSMPSSNVTVYVTFKATSGGTTSDVTTLYVSQSYSGIYVWSESGSSTKKPFGEWDNTASNVANATATKTIDGTTYKVLTFDNDDAYDTFNFIARTSSGQSANKTGYTTGKTYIIKGTDTSDVTVDEYTESDTVYYLEGEFNSWSHSKNPFTVSGSSTVGYTTVSLAANTTYKFKVYANSNEYSNSGTMTSTNCTDWTMDSSVTSSCQITTTTAGDYTFAFNTSTKKLSVTYPASGDSGYKLVNGSTSLGNFSTTSTENTYTLTVQLEANKTYKLYILDKNSNSSSRAPYYDGDTLKINGSVTLYRYNDVAGGTDTSSKRVSFTPTASGTYTFTWVCDIDDSYSNRIGDTTYQMEGAKQGTLSVEKAGYSVAESVKLSSTSLTYTEGDSITLTTETTGLADGLDAQNLTYTLYDGSTVVEPKSGSLNPTFTISNVTSGTHSYKVVLSTSATSSLGEYNSVTSNTLNITASGKGVYYSSDITSNTSNVTWNDLSDGKTDTITVAKGGTYTIAFSDKAGFNEEVPSMNYSFDEASSKYVTLSTGTCEYNETAIQTYIIKANSGTKNLKITINPSTKKISATAEIDKDSFVDSTNTYVNKTEYVTYYFAEHSNSTNHTDASTGDGMRIRYWNNSYDNATGGTTVNVTEKAMVNGSNKITVNTKAFYYKPSSNVGTSDTYYVYKVDLPVKATSFAFVSKDGSTIPTKSFGVNDTYYGSLLLNSDRIYCYYSSNNKDDNYCSAVPLDESFWTGTSAAANGNQITTQNFKTNIVNYAAYEKTGGYVDSYGSYSNLNSVLTGVWSSSYEHPLYFGYLTNAVSGSHNFKLWENLALRKSDENNKDERYYYASVQGLAGDTLKSVSGSQYGQLQLADESGVMPLFDYNNSTVMNKIAYKVNNQNQVYTSKNFPLNKSEYDGVVTYSYDSTVDYNRVYSVSGKDFKLDKTYATTRLSTNNSYLAYSPFVNYKDFEYGFGQEFEVEFYMTPTGKLSTKSGESQDITFDFSGDDDVWVYVDGVLVLDLGGAHKISSGSINFSDMKVYYKSSAIDTSNLSSVNDSPVSRKYIKTVDLKQLLAAYGVNFNNTDSTESHTLQMFYMERGSFESNMSISFNLPQSSGLTVTSKIDSSKVNPGLASAALDTANGDYFSYTVTDKLITSASELDAITNAVKALDYTGVEVPTNVKSSVDNLDHTNFEANTGNLYYQSGYDVSRNYGDDSYKLNSGDKGSTSTDYLDNLTKTAYKAVSNVVFERRDSYLVNNNENDKIYKATGKTDSNGTFNLLFDESAVFDSSILANTFVQVGQNDSISKVTNTSTAIGAEASDRTVSQYYSTSYELYDNGSKKTLSSDNSTIYSNGTVYANEVGGDDNFYFANYDSTDSDNKSVAMTVTYTNTIEVGSIKIEKKLTSNENTLNRFYFDVEFKNVFGGTQGWSKYSTLTYDVYDAATGTKVNTQPYSYGTLGVVITPGEYAIISGVPVGTEYRITERATAGFALSTASGVYTDRDGNNETDMEVITNTNDKISGLSGKILALNSNTEDETIQASALFTNEPQSLTITYKYYDRDVATGQVSHISETPTSYTKTYATMNDYSTINGTTIITKDEQDNVIGFDMEKLIELSSVGVHPNNVIDKYIIFTSQEVAVAEMVKQAKIYKDGNYSEDEAQWHVNAYGRPVEYSKWITYKDANGKTYEETDLLKDPAKCALITEIEVWAFNTLQQYTVKANYAIDETDIIINDDGKYIASGNKNVFNATAYYNQRLGGYSSHDDQNDNGFYLTAYNLEGYINSRPASKESFEYETADGETVTLYFQYWIDENGAIISTNHEYMYRVTNDITLTAVYDTTPYKEYGLSITENEVDRFFDGKGTAKTRLNVMFNPYGLSDYSDIEKTAVLYINATNFDIDELSDAQLEELRTQVKTIFEDTTGANIKSKVVNVTLTEDKTASGKANGFVYNVVDSDQLSSASNNVTLTSKNRLQFSTTFTDSSLEGRKFYAFAGMYYENKWTVSDNCIVFDCRTSIPGDQSAA